MKFQQGLLWSLVCTSLACNSGDKSITVNNRAPTVAITQPVSGTVFQETDPVGIYGTIDDDDPLEEVILVWSSSIDGELMDFDPPDPDGNVELVTASLSEGIHVITLQAIDPNSQQGEATVTIEVLDVPENPTIEVWYPAPGDVGLENEEFIFMAEVSDRQEAAENLRVDIVANPGGPVEGCLGVPVDGTGFAQCTSILDLGTYTLTFKATDSDGNEAQDIVEYSVVSRDDYDQDGDGYTPNGGDCNDSNDTIYPGAPELCDTLDNDCSEHTEIDHGSDCYDDDGDGYCEAPPCINTENVEPDCNDASVDQSPISTEVVNYQDDNCDGRIDEGTVVYDDDGDGYCETPPCVNSAKVEADCNDEEFTINPGQTEVCDDGLDNDCDGSENQKDAIGCSLYYADQDGDGYGVLGASQCWCEPSYPFTGDNGNDCYDLNPEAYPNNPNYYSTQRGDGSFDYNCNNSEEKQYVGISGGCQWGGAGVGLSCETNAYGWQSVEPSCGASGLYINDCNLNINWLCWGLSGAVAIISGNWSAVLQAIATCNGTCTEQYSNSTNTQLCK